MESFQDDGWWWEPANPDHRWYGTLRFDETAGISLTIVQPVETPDFKPPLLEYERLFGMASSGKEFTLIDCRDHSTRGSFFGVPRPIEIQANRLIAGFHSEQVDPPLETAAVRLAHANEWRGRCGIEVDTSVAPPDFAPRFRTREPLVLYDDGTFVVKLRSWAATSISNFEARMRQRVTFEVQASTPRPFSEFEDYTRACTDLLSIACLSYCRTKTFSIVPPRPPGAATSQLGTFHAVPFYKTRDHESSSLDRMLFRFSDIESRAPAIFEQWLSKRERLRDARVLYISGIYGKGFIEHRLMALTQSAEALHRRFFRDRYMDEAAYEADVLRPLTAAIPAAADPSLRQSLKARLKYGNEHSLRRRLTSLFATHAAVLRLLVVDPEDYVGPIVDLRNEFTHFPVPAPEAPQAGLRPEALRVLRYKWILRLLLEACFLTEMGFSSDEIVAFVTRCDTYRQMSERFGGPLRSDN